MKTSLMGKIGCFVFGFALLAHAGNCSAQSVVTSKNNSIVSVDTLLIMQKSQEGKKLASQIQKEIESFQGDVKKAQGELVKMQEDLGKKSKVLSADAMQEKAEALTQKKKEMESKLAGKEESLRTSVQRKQVSLRERQLTVANEVFEKEGWALMLDRNLPGVLGVAKTIDKTDEVLKAVDAKYAQASAASAVKPAEKKTIKTA